MTVRDDRSGIMTCDFRFLQISDISLRRRSKESKNTGDETPNTIFNLY
jgi:hypothetical protein